MPLTGDVDILKEHLKDFLRGKNVEKMNENLFNGRIDVSKMLIDMFPRLFERKITRIGSDGLPVEQPERDYSFSLPAVLEKLLANRRQLNL